MRLLTLARDLKRRRAREKHQLFVAEGVRSVEELLRSAVKIRGALVAPQLLDAPRGAGLAGALREKNIVVEEVPANVFGSAAETEAPQGVLAIAEVPPHSFSELGVDWSGIVLVLDAVQDPGNVGTILRTAAALGVAATIALPGTVDLWNAKVVRSGMGSHFRHLAFSSTWAELDSFRTDASAAVFVADAAGQAADRTDVPSRIVLIVGNEGAGVSQEARSRADRVVSIPITSDVESLNVAVATGILLYSLRP